MMPIYDYFLLLGWSLEAITALGISLACGLGVIGFMMLLHRADQDRAGSLGFAPAAPGFRTLPVLPKRVPGATLIPHRRDLEPFDPDTEREIEQTLRIVAPLDTPDPRLQLADDSIPLAAIRVDDLDFMVSVLADIDDEFRTDQGAGQ